MGNIYPIRKGGFTLLNWIWNEQVKQQTDDNENHTNQKLLNSTTHLSPLQQLRLAMVPIMTAAYTIAIEATVYAAEAQKDPIIAGSWKLIRLLQRFAFPVGVGMAIWGAIEYIMDNPGGKERIQKAAVGYVLVFIIPLVFLTLQSAFNDMITLE